jgi:hypothetical protein
MVRGQALSDDLRGVILNMARQMNISRIVSYTGQKKRTVARVISDYRHQRTVARRHVAKELRGAKRSLTAGSTRVSSTVYRSACRHGLTMHSFFEVPSVTAPIFTWMN